MSIAAGEIYFIGEKDLRTKKFTDYYKVGIVRENAQKLDRDSVNRLHEHQTGNPRELYIEHVQKSDLVELVETLLHKQFAPLGVRGEWMLLTKKELEAVKASAKALAAEAKGIAANLIKVEALSKQKSDEVLIKPTKKMLELHQDLLLATAKMNSCNEIMDEIAQYLAQALEQEPEDVDEPEVVPVKAFAKVQERKGKTVIDYDAFAAKYPKLYAKFVTKKTTISPRASFSGVRGLEIDFKKVDPAFAKTISAFEPLYKKVLSGKAKVQELHQFNLDLHPVKVEAEWTRLKCESALKIACGTHLGIDGILKWSRVEKVTESVDKKALLAAYPDKFKEFTTTAAPTQAIIIDPKKGY